VKRVFFTLCVVVEKKVLTREMIHNWFIIVFLSSFTRLCLFLEYVGNVMFISMDIFFEHFHYLKSFKNHYTFKTARFFWLMSNLDVGLSF